MANGRTPLGWLGRLATAASVVLAAGLLTAPTAAAEDDCSGSFVDFTAVDPIPCGTGFDYTWHDNDRDSAPTALHLSGCSGNPDVTLMRFNGVYFQPIGTKRFYCLNTDGGWKEWGRQRAGDYRFEINPRTANGKLTVSYFHGGW